MGSTNKKSWKLQDIMAHNANVNCLALGHKSGRVMVTGGDDKKVNLWAIGKQSCFMSLSGHTTPIDCVQFNQLEELVCAGSRAGTLKVWDLEAAKLLRTLNGHKFAVKSIDFNPYGDLLASGSEDCSIKIWDTRKKGVIFTYNSHQSSVNSLKFSPDGKWVASGGEDGPVKIWDLRVGRVLKNFTDHSNAVTCVEFHPHEFLLATGSMDGSINFFDLEDFNLVSSSKDLSPVRCLCFNPEGDCLFTGVKDYLKIVGWEPNRLFDSVPVMWGRIADVSTAQNQLVGASFHLTNVQVYVVDLKKVHPFRPSLDSTIESSPPSPFSHNLSIRKSFSKAERPVSLKNRTLDVKTIEENTSGTDPEEESSSAAITNYTDYNEIFKGRGLVTRTPPPEPEPFKEPEIFQETKKDYTEPQILGDLTSSHGLEALSLDNNINNYRNSPPPVLSPKQYSRSKSNLDQVYVSPLSKERDRENILPNAAKVRPAKKFELQRQNSCKEVPEKVQKTTTNNSIKHSVSEANINKRTSMPAWMYSATRKNSVSSSSSRNSSVSNVVSKQNLNSAKRNSTPRVYDNNPVDIYVNRKLSPEESVEEEGYVPSPIDKPVGLNLDDFLPKNDLSLGFQQQSPNMSDAEVLNVVMRGHEPMMGILKRRHRNLQVVQAQHRSKDLKTALETAVSLDDISVVVDILGVIVIKNSLWDLDLCVVILPKVEDLLESKFETYTKVGCKTLTLILKHFGSVIKSNIKSPVGSFGVDISREERFQKSQKCFEMLSSLKSYILKKRKSFPGGTFREILMLLDTTLD